MLRITPFLLLSTVGPSDEEGEVEVHEAISSNLLRAIGVIVGIIGGALAFVHPAIAGMAAIAPIVWGANAVREVANYGLGTGVPSIGYMGLGGGVVAAILGAALTGVLASGSFVSAACGLIVGTVVGAFIGGLLGFLDRKVIGMKIPVMTRCSLEIVAAGTLALMCLMGAVAGDFSWPVVYAKVIKTGIIALLWVLCAMSLLHPFNACLGPSETQERTLALAAECGSVAAAITGVVTLDPVLIIAGVIAWVISFSKFWKLTKRDAAEVTWTGIPPKGQ